MNRQLAEDVLGGIDCHGEERGQCPGEHSRHHASQQPRRSDEDGVRGDRKQRTDAEQIAPGRAGGDAGQRHGDQAARLPLEQQQFHGQQDGRHRRGEGGRHATGRASHQKRLPFRAG